MEPDMTAVDISRIASLIGFPAAFCLILVIGAFKGARWFAPKVEAMITAHVSLVSTLQDNLIKQTSLMDSIQSSFSSLAKLAERQADALQKTSQLLEAHDSYSRQLGEELKRVK